MLLLDQNKRPQNTVFYLAAVVSGVLAQADGLDYASLLEHLQERLHQVINPTFFSLALNFLFLLDKLQIDDRGGLHVSQ